MTSYEQGFMNKCAEYGIDGKAILKAAQVNIDSNTAIGAGAGALLGGGLGALTSRQHRLRNALILALLGGGAGAATGHYYGDQIGAWGADAYGKAKAWGKDTYGKAKAWSKDKAGKIKARFSKSNGGEGSEPRPEEDMAAEEAAIREGSEGQEKSGSHRVKKADAQALLANYGPEALAGLIAGGGLGAITSKKHRMRNAIIGALLGTGAGIGARYGLAGKSINAFNDMLNAYKETGTSPRKPNIPTFWERRVKGWNPDFTDAGKALAGKRTELAGKIRGDAAASGDGK